MIANIPAAVPREHAIAKLKLSSFVMLACMIARRRDEATTYARLLCENFHKTPWPHQDAKGALMPGLLPRLSDVPNTSFPQLPDKIATALESAALPPDNIHRCMALDSCKSAIGPRNRRKNWAGSMYRAIIDTGYQLAIRLDDMDAIDITALRHFITQRRDAVWEGLDVCPRTCPSVGARLCTYAAWFARPPHKHARSLLDLPLSSRCMQTLFRFRMGVHRLPKDEGSWNRVPRHERLCLLCNLGSLCDEKHVVFECSALQGLRDEYASLFSDVCTMKQFLWQDDLVSVAKFIHACLDKMFSCETGLPNDSQASDQPDVAGRDVT